MRKLPTILLTFAIGQGFAQADNNIRQVPSDLNKLGVTSFYEPKEILRIWRFPEGGAAFEEMIDFIRTDKNWTVIKYTYLLEQFRDDKELRNLRKKVTLIDKGIINGIPTFINKDLQLKDTQLNPDGIYIEDLYKVEYRLGDNLYKFDICFSEKEVKNKSKNELIKTLKQIIVD
jgi:hypothetical protein